MPNLDGTGPRGQRPGFGRGLNNRPVGSNRCTCPKCGYQQSHQREKPCSQTNCPKCKTPLKGVNCL